MKIQDCIQCPKCRNQFMKKSLHPEFGREYFCHFCHTYFGVNELVNHWGYDAGDLFGYISDGKKWVQAITDKFYPEGIFSNFMDEPYWANLAEYQDAQAMTTRMFLGIPELDEWADHYKTYMDALDIGIQ